MFFWSLKCFWLKEKKRIQWVVEVLTPHLLITHLSHNAGRENTNKHTSWLSEINSRHPKRCSWNSSLLPAKSLQSHKHILKHTENSTIYSHDQNHRKKKEKKLYLWIMCIVLFIIKEKMCQVFRLGMDSDCRAFFHSVTATLQ